MVVLLRKSLLTRPGHESGVRDRRGGPAVLVLWLVRSWRGIVVKTRMANLTGEAQESTNFYGKRSLLLAVCNEITNNVPNISLFQLSLRL